LPVSTVITGCAEIVDLLYIAKLATGVINK
jgi:hypothetical protein